MANSAMSLDSRQTVLGPTSRPVVPAAGRGIDEARFPRSPLNRVSQPFWSRARQRNGASIHRRALYERGKWVEAGLRKAAIGSVGGGLGTEAALGIEPVTSSLAGASLPPLESRRSRTPESPRLQFRAESGGSGLARAPQRDVALLSPQCRLGGERDGNFTVRCLTVY